MFRKLYNDPKFLGAQISPPNKVAVIMEDGIEQYTVEGMSFHSEVSIDKHGKQLKGTEQEKDNIRELFIEPDVNISGRFTTTMYDF